MTHFELQALIADLNAPAPTASDCRMICAAINAIRGQVGSYAEPRSLGYFTVGTICEALEAGMAEGTDELRGRCDMLISGLRTGSLTPQLIANAGKHFCSIGHCIAPATRRLEIRRNEGDEHPAEIRRLCASALCLDIAQASAAGLTRSLNEGPRQTVCCCCGVEFETSAAVSYQHGRPEGDQCPAC